MSKGKHGGWTTTVKEGKEHITNSTTGCNQNFKSYWKYPTKDSVSYVYFPVSWVDEDKVDQYLKLLNDAGFYCEKQQNIKNILFSDFKTTEDLIRVRVEGNKHVSQHHFHATFSAIRYAYSNYYNGLIECILNVYKNLPIKPLEAIMLGQYVSKMTYGDRMLISCNKTGRVWVQSSLGLMYAKIYKLQYDINNVFLGSNKDAGINIAFEKGEKYDLKEVSKELTPIKASEIYNANNKRHDDIKGLLEDAYQTKDWKALKEWYKILRIDTTPLEGEEPKKKKKSIFSGKKKLLKKKKLTRA